MLIRENDRGKVDERLNNNKNGKLLSLVSDFCCFIAIMLIQRCGMLLILFQSVLIVDFHSFVLLFFCHNHWNYDWIMKSALERENVQDFDEEKGLCWSQSTFEYLLLLLMLYNYKFSCCCSLRTDQIVQIHKNCRHQGQIRFEEKGGYAIPKIHKPLTTRQTKINDHQ